MNRTDAPMVLDGDRLRQAVEWAMMSRRSIRAYLPTPVPQAMAESILDVARFAASGVNTQPWRVHVVTGQAKDRVCAAIRRVNGDSALDETCTDDETMTRGSGYRRTLKEGELWVGSSTGCVESKRTTRNECRLNVAANINSSTRPSAYYSPSTASCGRVACLTTACFCKHHDCRPYSRRKHVPSRAFMKYHRVIADQLRLEASEKLVVGMSLGFADHSSIENRLVTERAEIGSFTSFYAD
jgi:nitroreductase